MASEQPEKLRADLWGIRFAKTQFPWLELKSRWTIGFFLLTMSGLMTMRIIIQEINYEQYVCPWTKCSLNIMHSGKYVLKKYAVLMGNQTILTTLN